MNLVILSGNVTKDCELQYLQGSGTAKAKFSLAVRRDFKDKNGEYQTDFFNCIMWGKTAENLAQYLVKGTKIIATGSLVTGSYEKDGVKHYTTDVNVQKVEFIGSKPKTEYQEDHHDLTPVDSGDSPF